MKKFIITIVLLTLTLISFQPASAQLLTNNTNLEGVTDTVGSTAHLSKAPLGQIIAVIIKTVLSLLAIVFLVLIIMAGIRWMTASGNEEALAKAKKGLTTAIIGLIIILAAYIITYFIFKYLPFGGSTIPSVTGSG